MQKLFFVGRHHGLRSPFPKKLRMQKWQRGRTRTTRGMWSGISSSYDYDKEESSISDVSQLWSISRSLCCFSAVVNPQGRDVINGWPLICKYLRLEVRRHENIRKYWIDAIEPRTFVIPLQRTTVVSSHASNGYSYSIRRIEKFRHTAQLQGTIFEIRALVYFIGP